MQLIEQLQNQFPQITFVSNEPLAKYTTVKIGGPAEVFCMVSDPKQFLELVQYAKQNVIPLTMIGWGANSLISDAGIRGLVIKNNVQDITIHDEITTAAALANYTASAVMPRWQAASSDNSPTYEFKDLDYHEETAPRVLVTVSSGVSLPAAINTLLSKGVTGLQWYSRIPATIGGAIYNNIHGGTHFIGEVVAKVRVISDAGETITLTPDQLEFDYDYSRFHHSKEVIFSVDFLLFKGDTAKAQAVAMEWAKRKAVQPQNSLGCIFQNVSDEDQQRLQLPTPSIGYVIQHVLGLQGYQVGDAKVSMRHAAFVENIGSATASDYLTVVKKIVVTAQEKCGLILKPEIFFLGFTPEQLKGIVQPR